MGSRRTLVLLSLILLTGLSLRVWYASYGLREARFRDERYSLLNIESILLQGTLKPAKTYYPSPVFNLPAAALWAISAQVHEWTGDPRFAVIEKNKFTPTAYLLCRLLQVVYGTAGIFLTFLVGRRMFSARVGLVGALALAFTPWHIHASGYFKPDAMLVFVTLLAFYWALGAVEKPSAGRYALAGLGVALAASAKMTGGLIAVPLVVGTLLTGWRQPRRIALLTLAGTTALIAFVALNPYWSAYPYWLASLQRDYAMRARWEGMRRAQIPWRVIRLMADRYVLGSFLGTFSLLGGIAYAVGAVRSAISPVERVARWMLISFPLAYTAAYAYNTAYFKANNFLPLVPFACLLLGWVLVGSWQGAVRHFSFRTARPATTGAGLALVLLLVPQGYLYVYRSLTPTTRDAALVFLSASFQGPDGRLALVEKTLEQQPRFTGRRPFGRRRAAIRELQGFDGVSPDELDLSDGVIFPRHRLDEPDHKLYTARIEGASPRQVRSFEPSWFDLRGPALVAVRHDYRYREPMIHLSGKPCGDEAKCLDFPLPEGLETGELVSLAVWAPLRVKDHSSGTPTLRIYGETLDLFVASRPRKSARYVTARFTIADPSAELRLLVPGARGDPPRGGVGLCRWIKRE